MLGCIIVLTIWKEAGFFMIFYLAALQSLPPELEEAARLEGASRWHFFRRVTFPLLMPTTLFVLINAVINSFKLVDQLFILTKGGPDNASSLLLYYIYEVASASSTRRTRRRLPSCCWRCSRSSPSASSSFSTSGFTTDERRRHASLRGVDRERGGAAARGPLAGAPALRILGRVSPAEYSIRFDLLAPLTLENFVEVWDQAPFARYFLNTFLLVTSILAAQFVLCTLAAYAFARFEFPGQSVAFALVLVQLMIMPEVLIVENYRTMTHLGLVDTILGIGLPYMASAFGIFLLRQTFKTVPKELDDAARVEGCSRIQILWKVYVPLAKPTYIAYGLVSISYHWNNFLWPLVITNSVTTRPMTVGLAIFGAPESGVDWSIISAATLLAVAPLLLAFLLFQRQFVQSFMYAGIK